MTSWPEATPFVPHVLLGRPPEAPRHWQVEGTLAYLDISGFTSLSEQLARRGRVGTEELVSTLTRIFTVLMSASDDGGDVLKFAGDAMLILYDGPDHARHATHAAAAVQRLLRVVGDVHLAGARARLSMSVGIHSGRFDLLLTGTGQQSLVVGGPDLDTVMRLQDRAAAGQVLVSPTVAAALPASAVGSQDGDAVELTRMPPVEAVGSLYRPRRDTDVARFLPAPLVARPDLVASESDHRRAAVGFVRVEGLRPALERGDALARVDELTAVVEDACRRFDVTLLDTDFASDGFRYFLAAGTPRTVDDPEGRLLQALFAVCGADGVFAVRAGASSGEVLAGAVGSSYRRTWTVMGEVTNLAARLTGKAPAGGVLAHAPMLSRARTLFEVAEHEPVVAKGKAEPLPVRLVTGVDGPRVTTTDVPLVGHGPELDRLLTSVGSGGRLDLVGDEGIGKTRVIDEAVRRTGRPVVRVGTDPYGAAVPYRTTQLLLRQLIGLGERDGATVAAARLREVVDERAPDLLPWLPLLGPAVGAELPPTREVDELDDRFRAARLREVVVRLLSVSLPADGVLVVDGGQWVDPTSVELLAAALADPELTASVLVANRSAQAGLVFDADTAVALAPLPDDLARQLALSLPGRNLRRSEVDAIVARAGGNPQFLLELAASGLGGGLPDSIEELVGIRIDELDGRDRDTLRCAAVLGSRFPTQLYAETTGDRAPDPEALEHGLAEFLELEGDMLGFFRELHREVAYEQLTFRRRRDLHGRAAAAIVRVPALAGPARLPMLSQHTFAAGTWELAYRWSREAAEEARAADAVAEAATFCRRALEAGRRAAVAGVELRDLQVMLGDLLNLNGEHAAAIAAYQSARRGLTGPDEVASVLYKIGMVRRESLDLRGALASARRVRELAAGLPGARGIELANDADLLTAGVRLRQGRSKEGRSAALAAAERAKQLPAGTLRTQQQARGYALHDTIVVELDGAAATYGERPLEMFREIGDLYNEGRFSGNVAVGLYSAGDWARAVTLYRRSLELAERIGDVFSAAVARMNIGEVLAYQGEGEEAVGLLTDSVSTLLDLDNAFAAAYAACFLGAAARVAGKPDDALHELQRSLTLFDQVGVASGGLIDEVRTRLLEVYVELDDRPGADEAERMLVERGSQLSAAHAARLHRHRAVLAGADGTDASDALAAIDLSLSSARALPLGYETALSLTVRDELIGDAAARAEADRILDGLGVLRRERLVARPPATPQ